MKEVLKQLDANPVLVWCSNNKAIAVIILFVVLATMLVLVESLRESVARYKTKRDKSRERVIVKTHEEKKSSSVQTEQIAKTSSLASRFQLFLIGCVVVLGVLTLMALIQVQKMKSDLYWAVSEIDELTNQVEEMEYELRQLESVANEALELSEDANRNAIRAFEVAEEAGERARFSFYR